MDDYKDDEPEKKNIQPNIDTSYPDPELETEVNEPTLTDIFSNLDFHYKSYNWDEIILDLRALEGIITRNPNIIIPDVIAGIDPFELMFFLVSQETNEAVRVKTLNIISIICQNNDYLVGIVASSEIAELIYSLIYSNNFNIQLTCVQIVSLFYTNEEGNNFIQMNNVTEKLLAWSLELTESFTPNSQLIVHSLVAVYTELLKNIDFTSDESNLVQLCEIYARCFATPTKIMVSSAFYLISTVMNSASSIVILQDTGFLESIIGILNTEEKECYKHVFNNLILISITASASDWTIFQKFVTISDVYDFLCRAEFDESYYKLGLEFAANMVVKDENSIAVLLSHEVDELFRFIMANCIFEYKIIVTYTVFSALSFAGTLNIVAFMHAKYFEDCIDTISAARENDAKQLLKALGRGLSAIVPMLPIEEIAGTIEQIAQTVKEIYDQVTDETVSIIAASILEDYFPEYLDD